MLEIELSALPDLEVAGLGPTWEVGQDEVLPRGGCVLVRAATSEHEI